VVGVVVVEVEVGHQSLTRQDRLVACWAGPRFLLASNCRGDALVGCPVVDPLALSTTPLRVPAVRVPVEGVLRGERVTPAALVGPGDAKNILALRDGLEVRWIHTPLVAAEVVDLQAVRDRTDEELVRPAMRGNEDCGPAAIRPPDLL
jgi:hypothetical protein